MSVAPWRSVCRAGANLRSRLRGEFPVSMLASYNNLLLPVLRDVPWYVAAQRRRYGPVGGIASARAWLLPLPPGPASAVCCLSDPR